MNKYMIIVFLSVFAGCLSYGMEILEGEIILLPERMTYLSNEVRTAYGLKAEDGLYGVSIQVTSGALEARKGIRYLLNKYEKQVLNQQQQKLSLADKSQIIFSKLENWHHLGHPFIGQGKQEVFPQQIPLSLVEKSLRNIAEGEQPTPITITLYDIKIKLYFALDKYSYGGETPCEKVSKALLNYYDGLIEIESNIGFAKAEEAEDDDEVMPVIFQDSVAARYNSDSSSDSAETDSDDNY